MELLGVYRAKIFVMGLLLLPVGGFMFFLAQNDLHQIEEFDEQPEVVALADLMTNKVSNRHWFHVVDFDWARVVFVPSENASIGQQSGTAYIPLWPRTGNKDLPSFVVARVDSIEEKAIKTSIIPLLQEEYLDAQSWNYVATDIDRVLASSPGICVASPKMLELNRQRPSQANVLGYRCWGTLWCTLSALCMGFVGWIQLRANTYFRSNCQTKLQKTHCGNVPPNVDVVSSGFEQYGFQFVAKHERRVQGKLSEHYSFLDTNHRILMEVIVRGRHTSAYVYAIDLNGTLFAISERGEAISLNGVPQGVPLVAAFGPFGNANAMIRALDTLLQSHGTPTLVQITSEQAGRVRTYYDLLVDWWAIFQGVSTACPDPVPTVDDLVHERQGQLYFEWPQGELVSA